MFDDISPCQIQTNIQQTVTHDDPEVLKLMDVEAKHIRYVLNKVHGRVEGKNQAADMLGLHPSTLRHRMKKLGIPYGKTRGKNNAVHGDILSTKP